MNLVTIFYVVYIVNVFFEKIYPQKIFRIFVLNFLNENFGRRDISEILMASSKKSQKRMTLFKQKMKDIDLYNHILTIILLHEINCFKNAISLQNNN